jgi:F-type H+-transporting ATPase subunit b
VLEININLLFNVINILVLAFLVRRFLFKPVKKILAERQALVQNSLDEAAAARAEAERLEQQHKELMQRIENEKLAAITEANKKAAEESEQLLQSARERADSIIKTAETEAADLKEEILSRPSMKYQRLLWLLLQESRVSAAKARFTMSF